MAISKLLREGQPLALQEQLHVFALRHLSASMVLCEPRRRGRPRARSGCGSKASRWPRAAWRAATARCCASYSVGVASDALEALRAELMPWTFELHEVLYELVLGSLAQAGAWGALLRLLQRALASLPEAEHEPLWQQARALRVRGPRRQGRGG